NVTGWTYYSRNGYGAGPLNDGSGDTVIRTYRSYQQFKDDTAESTRYNRAYHIKTSLDDDLAMTTYGDANAREKYHSIAPPSNNCADLTEEILDAGGHPIHGDNQYHMYGINGFTTESPEVPRLLFHNLVNSGMGHLFNMFP